MINHITMKSNILMNDISTKSNVMIKILSKKEKGSTLTEAIISLSILALGLSALLGMTAVSLKAKTISETNNMIGNQLPSLYHDMQSIAKRNRAATPEDVSEAVAQACARYDNCRAVITRERDNLYLVTILFTTIDQREESYCVYISTVYL